MPFLENERTLTRRIVSVKGLQIYNPFLYCQILFCVLFEKNYKKHLNRLTNRNIYTKNIFKVYKKKSQTKPKRIVKSL
jgi:hypothetical protein